VQTLHSGSLSRVGPLAFTRGSATTTGLGVVPRVAVHWRSSMRSVSGRPAPRARGSLKSCGVPPGSDVSVSLSDSAKPTSASPDACWQAESPLSFLSPPGNSVAPSSVLLACDRALSAAPCASSRDITLSLSVSQNTTCRTRPCCCPGLSSTLSPSNFLMRAPMCPRARSASLCAPINHSLASFPSRSDRSVIPTSM